MTRETNTVPVQTDPTASVAAPTTANPPRSWLVTVGIWTSAVLGLGLLAGVAGWYSFGPHEEPAPMEEVELTVEVLSPSRTRLTRSFEQAGTIQPMAQVDLYAKTSGYLLYIQRDFTPAVAASLLGHSLALTGTPLQRSLAVVSSFQGGPQIDIGSYVNAGDLLMEIDVPEKQQDIAEAEASLEQRQEELRQAHTVVSSFRAGVNVAKARLAEALANVDQSRSIYDLREKQLKRIKELARQRAVEPRLVDETAAEKEAAWAAWKSDKAKVTAAQAEVELAEARLNAAEGEVRVQSSRVRASFSELERARVLASYGQLRAPFSGQITFRSVDEGDFIQNSRTGQSRHLMTITASDWVKVIVQLPSREGVLVRPGAAAEITVDARPGERFYGWVSRTRGQLDVQSRTLQVEIDLDNRRGRLIPGMYAHVRLSLSETLDTWAIPASALFSRNKINYLIVLEDGVARRQPVRILFDGGNQVEVVKLIDDKEVPMDGSEVLIVSGKGALADGQPVRPVRRVARH